VDVREAGLSDRAAQCILVEVDGSRWRSMRVLPVVCLLLVVGLGTSCSKTETLGPSADTAGELPEADAQEDSPVIIIPPKDVVPDETGEDLGGDESNPDVAADGDATVATDLPDGEGEDDTAVSPEAGEEPPDLVEPPDVVELIEPPEVETLDPGKEIACVPSCNKKECGSDGCDGVCGFCAYGYICNPDGKCVNDICPKQCTATVGGEEKTKECGSDSCGGYCGYCLEAGTVCGEDGFCYAGQCKPDCKSKTCGPDGCGSACGFCEFGEMCDDDFKCVPHPCGKVTHKGQCEDKYVLVECVDFKLATTNCKTIEDKMCGWDQTIGKYSCIQEMPCVPQCLFGDGSPKECGEDGCWSTCGVCPKGWGCALGLCNPATGGECAWIDAVTGLCVGDKKWFCSAGKLYGYDCMEKEGKTCAWSPQANFGLGGYDCVPVPTK
jgi:hypothetical protein